MEWKLFDTPTAYVSTAEYHKERDHADHANDPMHRPRMEKAMEFIQAAAQMLGATREKPALMVDFGCGDGGLLTMLRNALINNVLAYGYDFAPNNVEAAHRRAMFNVVYLDLFPSEGPPINPKAFRTQIDIANMTEVIEHMTRPHEVLAHLAPRVKWVVASSPWNENDRQFADCHAWAWDMRGYVKLFQDAGFKIELLAGVGLSTVVLAKGQA